MIRSILIGILAVAIVSTGYWGYQEHQEKNQILINAENNYQRAFGELTYHIDQLHDEIGSTLAMNSRNHLSSSLADVWRITSQAQSELGQLPLALMPFNKTEEFLHNIGNFAYRTAVRDLNDEPLSDAEYKTLQQLYKNSGEIQNELRNVQSLALKNNLRWMDVELALASSEEPLDNEIINGFKLVDEKVEGFSEVDWGADMAAMLENDEDLSKNLKGEDINEERAKQIAMDFFNLDDHVKIDVNETGDGLEYKAYSLSVDDPETKANMFLDITKKGGHPVWALQHRDVKEQQISLNEASEKAKSFLEQRGIENMQLVDSKQYDKIGVFNFVYLENNVRVYSDSVVLEVALDNGDIVGYEAMSYLSNHRDRDLNSPKIDIEEAKTKVNPNLEVMEDHIALIKNDIGEEVLCYELFGTINNDTYRIFINAEDGSEEQVEKLRNAEPVYDNENAA
ncbi:germination protein YpeB [Anaerobacillus sp. MEB173]|uniref:germination protein YpeB n=1 Tax=Anaerobacillus sp. MEB173 TaxID=3383345 RepID=UPI003F91EE8D